MGADPWVYPEEHTLDNAGAERSWREACSACGGSAEIAEVEWLAIAAAYAAPWRAYHTMTHVSALLGLRRQHASLFQEPEVVDLAIVLHDVVYDPKRNDNEEQSARWASACLGRIGVGAGDIARAVSLIELSRHDPDEATGLDPHSDAALFLDLDLSVLAAVDREYAAYAIAVRREYEIYPDPLYRQGRAKVLKRFLDRRRIYCSMAFGPAWEDRARRNIENEIAALDGP